MAKLARRVLPIVASLIVPSAVLAHGTGIYVSTPISPPLGFRWVPWAFLGVLLSIAAAAGATARRRNWLIVGGCSALLVAVFSAGFFALGLGATTLSTAPDPGLGPPRRVFWGLGWREVGILFVFWNVFGAGILAALAFLVSFLIGPRGAKHRLIFAATCVVAYVLFLVPYVSTGALTHGWTGSYVDRRCQSQVAQLANAIQDYAKKNEGRMPPGKTAQEVFENLKPHLRHWKNWAGEPIYKCPLASEYERDPWPYVWNAELQGKALYDVAGVDPPVPLLSCPYKHPWDFRIVLLSSDLSEPPDEVWSLIGMRSVQAASIEQREISRTAVRELIWKTGGKLLPRWEEESFRP